MWIDTAILGGNKWKGGMGDLIESRSKRPDYEVELEREEMDPFLNAILADVIEQDEVANERARVARENAGYQLLSNAKFIDRLAVFLSVLKNPGVTLRSLRAHIVSADKSAIPVQELAGIQSATLLLEFFNNRELNFRTKAKFIMWLTPQLVGIVPQVVERSKPFSAQDSKLLAEALLLYMELDSELFSIAERGSAQPE